MSGPPVAVSSAPFRVAIFEAFVVDARKNVTSTFVVALLALEIVVRIDFENVVAVRAAVRRVGGLFVRGRAFLLLMLLCSVSMVLEKYRGRAKRLVAYRGFAILLVEDRDSVSVFDYSGYVMCAPLDVCVRSDLTSV